ncbi:MAG: DUF4340 domain-containing protein [Spirochaetaceae bacterium]|nr:MAG: DUF4340 domain-containing protein [Spirochaetaceae bacterium]
MSELTRKLIVRGAIVVALAITLMVGLEPGADRIEPLVSTDLGWVRELRVTDERNPHDVRNIVVFHDGVEWVLDLGDSLVPAREDRVVAFLRAVAGARARRTVTSRESEFASFGVGDQSIRVTVDGERAPVRIAIGDDADPPGSFYARIEPDGRVVVADGGAAFFVRQPAVFWAYLRVFPESVRRSDIVAVSAWALDADGTIRRSRAYRDESDTWRVSGEGLRDEPVRVVNEWTAALADLVGAAFVIAETDESAGDPVAGLTYELSDGRSYGLSLRIPGLGSVADAAVYPDLAWITATGPGLPSERFAIAGYRIGIATVQRLFPGLID